jgi:adenine deaminase
MTSLSLIVKNARVIDGTDSSAYVADIAIADDEIDRTRYEKRLAHREALAEHGVRAGRFV